MQTNSEETKLAIAAVYRILIASLVCTLSFITFFYFFPSSHSLDLIIPALNTLLNVLLLLYFHLKPYERIETAIKLYAATAALSFLPASLFYIWGAWQGYWRLIDRFPPITGILIALLVVGMIMLPKKFKKIVILAWLMVAIPILFYLLNHPNEMNSPRGYELFSLFGPTSLIFYVLYPYQSGLNQYINKIAFNLKLSEAAADRDFLTDLYNRRGLQHWLGQLNHDDHISVILIDIDHFKSINDRYGHGVGDNILVETASRLRSIYFDKHAVARWGGEEFVVILTNPNTESFTKIGDMFQIALSNLPYKTVGKLTVSVGQSNIRHHQHFTDLIEEADQALYYAKNNGRNQAALFNKALDNTIIPFKETGS